MSADYLTKVAGVNAVANGLVTPEVNDPLRRELDELKDRLARVELALKSPPEGLHNAELQPTFDKVIKGDSYREQSVVMCMPTISYVHPKVAFSWRSVMTPANHPAFTINLQSMEVGDAYNTAIRDILSSEELSKFKYVCTFESDNIVPPHGLLQLMHDIHEYDLDGISACYFTKGPDGVPQCWGRWDEVPRNFRPVFPQPNSVTRCNAIGMGFAMFKIDLFRRVSKPWFKTMQQWHSSSQHETLLTQDIFFCDKAAREAGAKFGVSTRVLVGHIDKDSIIW